MPTLARRTIALAALAVAIIAAAVALDLQSAQAQSEGDDYIVAAQSDDEQTGRIVARRLDDGRTEFGWRLAGGERVLPRLRYFPTDAAVDRWLNSSPVEVDGAEIGRINARLRSDGRIEFAFTPTDGERIEPSARYFPADARVGRWLRSTEIAIGPPTPATGFSAVSARSAHSCAIRESGAIECWGFNSEFRWNVEKEAFDEVYYGQNDAPDATDFSAVSAGGYHTCALRESGEITCWGANDYGQTAAPAGSFSAVSAGFAHTCAIRESGEITCWGSNEYGQAAAPAGPFSAVSAGRGYTCAIRESGEITCWGSNEYGELNAPAP